MNTLTGRTTYDYNGDNCQSPEVGFNRIKYLVASDTATHIFYPTSKGDHRLTAEKGEYVITPVVHDAAYFKVLPDSLHFSFTDIGGFFTQDFCVQPDGEYHKLLITIIPLTPPARPGFDAKYKIVYENIGNQVEDGTITFTFDASRMDYVSATLPTSNSNAGLLEWEFVQLLPFEKREIILTLSINSPMDEPPVNADDKLAFYVNSGQARHFIEVVVVGSYDPNDKTCLQGETIAPEMVGDYVDYLIRFENTGNYAAENVFIKDVIDTSVFDINSLQIIDASHPMYTRILKGNTVEFVFDNIQLPFEDELNDGYVAFRIKTLPTLVLGNELKNKADIFFDFNFPIRTNETKTVVAIPTSVKDVHPVEIRVFPNPVRDYLTFTLPTGGQSGLFNYDIYNVYGQSVVQSLEGTDANRIDVRILAPGFYILHIHHEGKVMVGSFVKQ